MRAAILLLFWLATITPAVAEAPNPYVLIRALLELQTQIVQGKAKAREEQPKMLADIGKQFAVSPQELWAEPRNARASIVWLLSGGSPRTMRTIMRLPTFSKAEMPLARGALAFAEGRADQARELLAPVDALKLEPVLGAQIALVQAALVLSQDLSKSIEYLGIARLLAPGSLVEETALRRQISLVGQTADAATFAGLSRQYARRFKTSLYAQEFRETFSQTFMRIGVRASDDQVASLEPVLDAFDADERCRLSILIARASLLEGSWRSAASFADIVMRAPVDASCDVPRARLYRAAARIANANSDGDLLALQMLDPARLTPEDKALRKAALSYAKLAQSWPEPRVVEDPADIGNRGEQALAAAALALASTSNLIKETRR
jgi:chemotaxis protein MotC